MVCVLTCCSIGCHYGISCDHPSDVTGCGKVLGHTHLSRLSLLGHITGTGEGNLGNWNENQFVFNKSEKAVNAICKLRISI